MRLSLRYKAALLIALTEAVLLGLLLVFNLYATRRELETQLTVHAHNTAALVAASAREPVLALNLAQLGDLLREAVGKHRIVYAEIRDHRGRLLASAGDPRDTAGELLRAEEAITVGGSLFGTVAIEVSRAEAEAAFARTTRFSLAIVLFEMGLVAFISLALGWLLTRHLAELAKNAEAFARGDYTARASVRARDEVGELAQRFNDMAETLAEKVRTLAEAERRLRDMAENTSDWLWETDPEGRYTYVSARVQTLLGLPPSAVLGRPAFELMEPEDGRRLQALFAEVARAQRPFYGFEFRARRSDGSIFFFEANGLPILDSHGRLTGYRGVTRDITRRKEDEGRLVFLAEHDVLTGLTARHKFLERLEAELELATHLGQPLALLLIDLDDFKLVNDAYGHAAGDSVLRLVADLLARRSGPQHELARLGGDEFGLLARGADHAAGEQLARELIAAIGATSLDSLSPAAAFPQPLRLSASIGIALGPGDARDSQDLLAHADIALSAARARGHGQFAVYDLRRRGASPSEREQLRATVGRQSRLSEAIEQKRLVLEFQPIVCIHGRERRPYFEALLRLRDTEGKLHPATAFLGTAERTGQIVELDHWVLEQVLAAAAAHPQTVIAMNLSARTLEAPDAEEKFRTRLAASMITPDRLIFEITESTAVAEIAKARSFLKGMKALGFRVALDDFGTGFSSFSYLRHLPVDQIKVDGSFVRQLDGNRQDQIIVRAMLQLARELGLETVAEFVESEAVLGQLVEMGVDYVQGYHIGPPGPSLSRPALSLSWKGAPAVKISGT
jgi:diguanylate cyclase (GGDEF)-like protein/PAS domain S-box-containing protein